MEPGAKLAFELDRQQGAALVTKHETYREDIERRFAFERYIKKHYNSWVDFAREHGHDSNPKPVLVTGVDLTRDFAMVAYSNNSTRMECEFSVAVPAVASASLSLWGRWRAEGLVHTNCGPRSPTIETTPSSSSSDHATPPSTIPGGYSQCVFIRYYTMRRRFIPKIIKAGAGPHDLGDPDSDNDLSDFTYVQGVPSGNSDDYDVAYNLPAVSVPLVAVLRWQPTLDRRPIRIISTPLRRWYFRSVLCLYGKNTESSTLLASQVSDAESVVLHHDELSTLRQFLDNRAELDSLAKYDILRRLLIDKDGGCTSIHLTSRCD